MKNLFLLFSLIIVVLSCNAKNNTKELLSSPYTSTNDNTINISKGKYSLKDTLLFFIGKSNNLSYSLYIKRGSNILQLYVMVENKFILKDSIDIDIYDENQKVTIQDLDNDGVVDVIYQTDNVDRNIGVYALVNIKLSPQPKLIGLNPWLINPKYLPKENLIVEEGHNRRKFIIYKKYYKIRNNSLILIKQENFEDIEDEVEDKK